MIKVKVKLYGELEKYGLIQKDKFPLELPEGICMKELLNFLKIPTHQIMLIIKNGVKAQEEDLLNDGDEIIFLPVVGGG